ncbi:MAG: response regulator transcription factor [Alicyclobacillaceae bacterium]|nr:response regulator transcription factor [Alicyclobacillaceae bacterium]
MTPIRLHMYLLPPLLALGVQAALGGRVQQSSQYTDFQVLSQAVAEPADGLEDLLLTDFADEFDTHPQILQSLRRRNRRLRVLFLLPASIPEADLVKALRAGADGYLLQTATPGELAAAVDAVLDDHGYLEPQVTPRVLAELRKPVHLVRTDDVDVELTERELQLMQLAADGLNNVRIAQVLGVSEKTVRHCWSALFEKTGFSDRTQAVLWGIRTGRAELR